MKKVGIGCLALVGGAVVLVVVLLVVIAAFSGSHPSATSAKEHLSGHVGSTLHVPDNLDVTLAGYRLSTGNTFETPKSGFEYVIAHFRFHNVRRSNTDVASTGFTAKSQGVIKDPEFVSSLTKNQLDMAGTTLAPGGTLRADLVFQIRRGDRHAQIIYAPNGSGNDPQATWTISG